MTRLTSTHRRLLGIAVIGTSALTTAFGMWILIRFDQTPGTVAGAPTHWPDATALRRASGRPQILVFAHPFCTCTTASVEELAAVFVQRASSGTRKPVITDKPAITVVVVGRRAQADQISWWNSARRLDGSDIVWDERGAEALRFGARTSGYVLLYDKRGGLLFRGGVTGSRGHVGDNYGFTSLIAALDSGRPSLQTQPVFGCALEIAKTEGTAVARQ